MIGHIALGVGTILVFCSHALAGRLAGFGVTALWGAATAYFLMAPVYSLRVSSSVDLAALALYGTVGLVLAKTAPRKKRLPRNEPKTVTAGRSPEVLVDIKTVLADLASRSGIQVEASRLNGLRCSYEDAVRVLSDVLAAVDLEPGVRLVSFHTARRPGNELLFVHTPRVWPPPHQETITIGKREQDCSQADFHGWPSHLSATWFDNGNGRIYQISFFDPVR